MRILLGAAAALMVFSFIPGWLERHSAEAAMQRQFHGKWQDGYLVYTNSSIALAIDDINRLGDIRLVVEPRLGGRPFSGHLPSAQGLSAARSLAQASGLKLVHAGPHWALIEAR